MSQQEAREALEAALTAPLRAALAQRARDALLGGGPWRAPALRARLTGLLDASLLEAWLALGAPSSERAPTSAGALSLDGAMAAPARRAQGVYFTSDEVAGWMAALLDDAPQPGAWIVDLAAGGGALLVAAIARYPACRVMAVERHPAMAIGCAIAIAQARGAAPGVLGDRVVWGDGLAPMLPLEGAPVRGVLLNPPYLGEKGRGAMFRALREQHPHLARWFGPRQDLQYLFLHRALDLLEPGGRLVALTSAYWMQATGAKRLRQDLLTRATLERLWGFDEARLFADAPGHHSLILCARRGAPAGPQAPLGVLGTDGERLGALAIPADGTPWPPLRAAAATASREREGQDTPRPEGALLSALARDMQGFVSGADRVSARHRMLCGPQVGEVGGPGFLAREVELGADARALAGLVWRPVLRGSALEANCVYLTPPDDGVVCYLDEAVSPAWEGRLSAPLVRLRPVLERRREVVTGAIPWYRLHWPRDRAAQVGPKLVTPRRAPRPCFALDLSASAVSSDCTMVALREPLTESLAALLLLMLTLNGGPGAAHLMACGKRKGALLELYAQPLRAWPLPLRVVDGALRLSAGLEASALGRAMLHARDEALARALSGEASRLGPIVVDHPDY